MAQSATHTCTTCRTPIPATMRFCPTCGALASAAPTQKALPPQPYPQQQQAYQPPPASGRPQKKSAGGILKVGGLLLLLLLVLGTAGYFVLNYVGSRSSSQANSSQGSNGTGPTSATVKTTPINATVTYASVMVTLVTVQQAEHFADETTTSDPGMLLLRLNLKEQAAATAVTYLYSETAHLVLPDGTILPLFHQQYTLSPEAGIARTTWLDFEVVPTVQVNQTMLRLGKPTEAPIDIPLK